MNCGRLKSPTSQWPPTATFDDKAMLVPRYLSSLADHALARKMVLQYRAVECNENSLALGRSLGFAYFCSTIYARLFSS